MFICEVMRRGSMKLAGLSFSGPLLEFPDAAVRVEAELYKRKQDFKQLRSPQICYSPHYEKGNLATYWACFEVGESAAIPYGITAFEVPEQKYAKVICDGNSIGEAYQWIFKWIEENGYQRKSDAYEIECYYKSTDNDAVEEKVEIWAPIE